MGFEKNALGQFRKKLLVNFSIVNNFKALLSGRNRTFTVKAFPLPNRSMKKNANRKVGRVGLRSAGHQSAHGTIGLMLKRSIRRLLVVDERGQMKGILTQTDLGRVLDRQESGLVNRLLGGATPSAEVPQGAM